MKRELSEGEAQFAEQRKAVMSVPTPEALSVLQFQEHVKRYQIRKFTFDYYMHGLLEEAGQVVDAVHARRSDQEVACEIGDVLWYATAFSMELGDGVQMPLVWPEGSFAKPDAEVALLACVAKLSGQVKKRLRGDKALELFLPAVKSHRDEILTKCAEVALAHGTSLQFCAIANLKKLNDRFDRGALQGDGNNR